MSWSGLGYSSYMDWLDLVQMIADHGLANGLDLNGPNVLWTCVAKLIQRCGC